MKGGRSISIKMKHVDLHLHTTYSDGSCSPGQVVKDAALLGLNTIAITDHDHTAGYEEALEEANKWGIQLITGVEITTPDYHILGYNFDINNEEFQRTLEYSRKCQESIVKQRADILNNQGIPITFEKIRNFFPKSRLGKLNLVMSMVLDAECKKHTKTTYIEEIFDIYLRNNPEMDNIDKSKQLSSKQTIDAIHNAGGIAVLAHPFKDVKDPIKELKILKDLGLDGIEIQPNYNGRNLFYRKYAEENNLIITYGSDFHGARYLKRPLLARKKNKIKPFWEN
jgi:3',5'-nucleoside bisphosphate phosphatase